MADEPTNVNEFQELARLALPIMYYDLYSGGGENIQAFRRITFRLRVLVDVSRIDLSTTILGYKVSSPILIAPTALHKLAHPEEVATARAAAACNTSMVLSYSSTEATSDTGGGSNLPAFADSTMDASLNWKDIGWLRSITNLPILIKGLLTREDASKAVEAGVAGIIVSNHGARQLDYSPSTISALEDVVRAVQGKIPVLVDGGVRRGTDVFKALALSVQAVLVGRPVINGLAAKRESGVRRVVEMLKEELELTMALTGCPNLKDITMSHVMTEHERSHRSML